MAKLRRAEQLIEAGQFEAAREVVVEALHENYDDLQAWLLLTACARDRQEYSRALREALRIDPENQVARQMVAEMARQSSDAAEGELPPERADYYQRPAPQKASPAARLARALMNTFAFLLIVSIAGGVAYLFWQSQDETAAPPPTRIATLDPAQQCIKSVETTYNRLAARCPALPVGEVCLVNPAASVQSNTGQTDLLTLAGDMALISNLQTLETHSYRPDDFSWGLVLMNGQTSFKQANGDGLLLAVTSGVRVRFFDERLNQITFSSNPAPSTCDAVPPAGLLAHVSSTQSAAFEINGEAFMLSGTAFLQVDVAAGLRVLVLRGELSVVEQERVLRAGQWAVFDVDSSLITTDTPLQVFESVPDFRGEVGNLTSLGQALDLDVEAWQVPGVNLSPVITATPPPEDSLIPPTTIPTFTPEATGTTVEDAE